MMVSRACAIGGFLYVTVTQTDYLPHWALEVSELIGFLFLGVASFGRIWCLVFIAGRKRDVLVVSGPYSVVRNPLYLFSFIGAIGLGLATQAPALAGLLAVAFASYYHFVVKREETSLLTKFGGEYRAYLASVPRWIPSLRRFAEPEEMTIKPAKVRKGIFGATWFLWVFLLWEVVENLHEKGYLLFFR